MTFWFELALALGRTVGELQATLSDRERRYWQALIQSRGPIAASTRGDWHAAQIVSAQSGVRVNDCLLKLSYTDEPCPDEADVEKDLEKTVASLSNPELKPLYTWEKQDG